MTSATGLNQLMMNSVQLALWVATIVVGAITAWKAIHEIRTSRKTKAVELTWKLFDRAADDARYRDCLTMLDWSGRTYRIPESNTDETIKWEEVRYALRTDGKSYADKEVYVRDCFDAMLELLVLLQVHLKNDLISFEDVHVRFRYWANLMRARFWPELVAYAKAYAYEEALVLLGRIIERGHARV